MTEWSADPVFQSAIAPFAVALIASLLLYRGGWQWAALSVALGFMAAAWLIMDFRFQPLTSTRKIVLLGIVAAGAGLALGVYRGGRRARLVLLGIGGAAAVLWVVWPVLARREGAALWMLAGGAALYGGWLVAAMDGIRGHALRAGVTSLSLALGAGLSVVLGASAYLGQLASAVAAAAGGYLLVAVFFRALPAGAALTLPAAVLCATVSFAGTVYAKLPWFVLPILATIPLLARVPLPARARWLQAGVLLVATAPAAVAAVLVTWRVAGGPPL